MEVCRQALDRIARVNTSLNAFNLVTDERALDRAAEIALQEGGEIGVRVHPELIEPGLECDTRLPYAVAGHAIRVRSAAPGLCVGKDPIPGKIDESRLPPVVVAIVFS